MNSWVVSGESLAVIRVQKFGGRVLQVSSAGLEWVLSSYASLSGSSRVIVHMSLISTASTAINDAGKLSCFFARA